MTFADELLAIAAAPVANRAFGNADALREPLLKLQRDFGDEPAELPAKKELATVIRRFRAGEDLSSTEIIHCCSAASIEVDGTRILEELPESQRLLSILDSDSTTRMTQRTRRRGFRALSRSYFAWGPDDRASATTPWGITRAWLFTFLNSESLPDDESWRRITRHPNLFTTDPCALYRDLNPTSPEIKELARDFGIPKSSWFFEELFRVRLTKACAESDARFVEALDKLILELASFSSLTDWGLAMLLDRYAASEAKYTKRPHTGLQALALECWKTPRDSANTPAWNKVRKKTRDMVARWLVDQIIVDVFGAFDAKVVGSIANERAQYWRLWSDRIDDIYLFVDSQQSGSFAHLKPLIGEDHWKVINEGESGGANHAFLMQIGDYSFVEFSKHGNAMYPYETADVPFDLGRRRYGIKSLKDKNRTVKVPGANTSGDAIDAWTHQGAWQGNFNKRMQTYLSLRP